MTVDYGSLVGSTKHEFCMTEYDILYATQLREQIS